MNIDKNQAVEAEIIRESAGDFTSGAQNTSRSTQLFAWVVGAIALFVSFIPFIGFAIALIALFINVYKKVPPVLPILAIIIGSITTSLFAFFWLILKAIF